MFGIYGQLFGAPTLVTQDQGKTVYVAAIGTTRFSRETIGRLKADEGTTDMLTFHPETGPKKLKVITWRELR